MLFERRAYTLRPGNAERFWELQRKWNTPSQIPGLLGRNIGYFLVTAGAAEQVVHLYRFDSYDDWKTRLFGIYTAERADYFTAARKLLLAQENMFLNLAPIPQINPIWGDGRDWLPGKPFYEGVEDHGALTVIESTLDFLPGGLPAYWDAYKQYFLSAGQRASAHLIACFYTLVGPQHRVIHYRWYRTTDEVQQHQAALERDQDWQRFTDAYQSYVVRSSVARMRPSPVSWMKSLFTPIDWSQ